MSVTIRLSRQGAKKVPFYRIVATDSRHKRDGRHIELLGIYDPTRTPVELRYDVERVKYWVDNGAGMSDTVRELFKRAERAAAAAK